MSRKTDQLTVLVFSKGNRNYLIRGIKAFGNCRLR
jgi:hypothetical protein